ncbi:MAG: hypothetical protein KA479_09430 [Saprospiraceae bacterium]|nr:hypothetical protein [Saprospiraceae bacterium]
MFKHCFILLFFIVLFSACEKEKDEFVVVDTVPLYPHGNIFRVYAGMPSPVDSLFTFPSGAPVVLRSASGVVIEIEAFSFATSTGTIVDSNVRLHWTEIRKINAQIAHRLSMRTLEQILLPQAIYNLEVELEGEKLTVVKPIIIKWPATQVLSSLVAYSGIRPATHTFFWEPSQSGSVSVSTWIDPVNGEGVTGYFMVTQETGYGCAGKPEEVPAVGAGADLHVQFFPAYTAGNTAVYFLQSGSTRALALSDQGEGRFTIPNLGFGASGRLFCITEAVEKSYYSTWKDITFTAPGFKWEPRPAKQELSTVLLMLNAL